jgi:hypothetical protein
MGSQVKRETESVNSGHECEVLVCFEMSNNKGEDGELAELVPPDWIWGARETRLSDLNKLVTDNGGI